MEQIVENRRGCIAGLASQLPRCFCGLIWLIFALAASGQEAMWIWSPEHAKDQVPTGSCHFRKTVNVRSPEEGRVIILADDAYELHVNGRRIGTGQTTDRMIEYDIGRYLARGRNIIAVKVSNTKGRTAALAARVLIKESTDEWRSYSTDGSWKANLQPLPLWNTSLYNDSRWDSAQVFGQLGQTPPWDVRDEVATQPAGKSSDGNPAEASPSAGSNLVQASTQRFKIRDEFEVRELLDGDKTGSLIAMSFNEFGHILAARENGPLLLIYDSDNDGTYETVKPYCTAVKNCQGIVALNGEVFVTADGPEGCALYRLADRDQDGVLENTRALIKFGNKMGEHGPHGITLGPDGLLYLIAGNHTKLPENLSPTSPYWDWYEGDLIQPRYEDPTGHAAGVKAPGGFILRTDVDGKSVELFAGGMRNAYDLAFNREGDVFAHDSDMESDIGTTWYRPTRLFHVSAGAELGWRSGWAGWPDYYVDCLPGILDTDRGSPSGAVFYNHYAFPVRYHDTLFLADWSEGRILAVTVKRDGASYVATSEVFLQGKPLNVTDLDVGPDGGLYFCTGGRGTNGGIYRIRWKGDVPANVADLGKGISEVIRQPQFNSAWARQNVARVMQELEKSDKWEKQIAGVTKSTANPWYYRVRALQIMQLYGPAPTTELLLRLSKDENELVRANAAEMMGIHADAATHDRLVELLADPDRFVRRRAGEAMLRAGQGAPIDTLSQPLASDDRWEAFAARRVLERMPPQEWRDRILETKDHRVFIQGSLALMIAQPTEENAAAVTERFSSLMDEFISDRNFIDMLRVAQVALHRAPSSAKQAGGLSQKLAEEFPSSDSIMNRELMRLLAHMQVSSPMLRYLTYLNAADVAEIDRLHVALHLRFLTEGWPNGRRLDVIKFYEEAKKRQHVGEGFSGFISSVERDLARELTPEEGRQILKRGAQWPAAATGALYGLPVELNDETLELLTRLDQDLVDSTDDAAAMLRTGILAVLARSGQAKSFAHLRKTWENEPERRGKVAMGLAQQPGGENWPLLVRSLPILDGDSAIEVLGKLRSVPRETEDAEQIRQVILCGLRLPERYQDSALSLLQHWTGEELLGGDATPSEKLKAWQDWFAEKFPDRPRAELPVAPSDSKWQFTELLEHLTSDAGTKASSVKGAAVFEKAQCVKCHRLGNRGENLGPDLTSIAKRFTRKEVLESILFPSQVISDQFASKTVVTASGRTYNGVVLPGSAKQTIVLQSNGEKVALEDSQIDEIVASPKSAMPENLLDNLSLEEISDLFAYLGMVPTDSSHVARKRMDDTKGVKRR